MLFCKNSNDWKDKCKSIKLSFLDYEKKRPLMTTLIAFHIKGISIFYTLFMNHYQE